MPLPRDYVRLDDDQFAKLVELLTPGYELAKAYMASMKPADVDQEPEKEPERTTSADDESQKGGG